MFFLTALREFTGNVPHPEPARRSHQISSSGPSRYRAPRLFAMSIPGRTVGLKARRTLRPGPAHPALPRRPPAAGPGEPDRIKQARSPLPPRPETRGGRRRFPTAWRRGGGKPAGSGRAGTGRPRSKAGTAAAAPLTPENPLQVALKIQGPLVEGAGGHAHRPAHGRLPAASGARRALPSRRPPVAGRVVAAGARACLSSVGLAVTPASAPWGWR